jgi:hypothetical protein
MAKKNHLPTDDNVNPIQVMALSSPQDLDGSLAHAESAAIGGNIVRIVANGADIRFLIGPASTTIALTSSHLLKDGQEIYQPCLLTDIVSVVGGKAHVSTAGITA